MNFAAPLLTHALDQARAEWLAGDSAAWGRYADCLACLEQHGDIRPARLEPRPTGRPARAAQRRPRGLA